MYCSPSTFKHTRAGETIGRVKGNLVLVRAAVPISQASEPTRRELAPVRTILFPVEAASVRYNRCRTRTWPHNVLDLA